MTSSAQSVPLATSTSAEIDDMSDVKLKCRVDEESKCINISSLILCFETDILHLV